MSTASDIEARRGLEAEAHILVVEDDGEMRALIARFLRQNGYRVTAVRDGREMWETLAGAPVDLVLLDVMLPGQSGLDLCRALRARSGVPVIMVTARGEETDRVLGLELGADDYLTKPFSISELLARIRAVLRRASAAGAAPEFGRIGEIEVNFRTHQARRGDERVTLTSREFDLLRYFAARQGEVVTRDQILTDVWGYEEATTTRTIDNFVAKLRQKIERSPHQPEHLLTVHGIGYKFVG